MVIAKIPVEDSIQFAASCPFQKCKGVVRLDWATIFAAFDFRVVPRGMIISYSDHFGAIPNFLYRIFVYIAYYRFSIKVIIAWSYIAIPENRDLTPQ